MATMINSNGSGSCTGAGRGFPCQQKPATAQAFVVHCQQTMPAADLQWGRAEKHKPQIKRSKRIAPKEEKQDELATASHGAACGGEERNPRLKPHSRIIQSSDSREILVFPGDCWFLYLWEVNISNEGMGNGNGEDRNREQGPRDGEPIHASVPLVSRMQLRWQ